MDHAECDEMLRTRVWSAAKQDLMNADLREFNRQQVAINADMKTTLARIETLMARMIPTGENGREA